MSQIRWRILENWPIKLTALVLSAVLWAVVAAEEPSTQLVPVTLQITYANGQPVEQPLPEVRALYAGPARELLKLYAQPPVITRMIPDSAAGTDYTLQLAVSDLVTPPNVGATPQAIEPRTVTLRLEDFLERRVPVVARVTAVPDADHGIASPITVTPESVTVRGPSAQVQKVDRIETIQLHLTDLSQTVRRGVPLALAGYGGIRVQPSQVVVTVEVAPFTERMIAGVPVRVAAENDGTWISDPPVVAVTVRGLPQRLEGLSRDSVTVLASPGAVRAAHSVPLEVRAPPGVAARVTPDSVRLRRARG